MAYIIPPGFSLVAFRHSITGDPEEMVCLLGLADGTADPLDLDDVNGAFTGWKNALDTSLTSSVTFVGATFYIGQDGGDTIVVESTAASGPGLGSGTSLPPNCAYLCKKQSASSGRANRGRFFLPGLNEGNVSPAGVLDPSQLTQINTDLAAMKSNIETVGFQHVILHSTGSTLAPTPITSFSADSKIATQRRRLR